MKQNLLKLYKNIILQDKWLMLYGASIHCVGWGEVIKSKILEIHNNNYTLKDNYLF